MCSLPEFHLSYFLASSIDETLDVFEIKMWKTDQNWWNRAKATSLKKKKMGPTIWKHLKMSRVVKRTLVLGNLRCWLEYWLFWLAVACNMISLSLFSNLYSRNKQAHLMRWLQKSKENWNSTKSRFLACLPLSFHCVEQSQRPKGAF